MVCHYYKKYFWWDLKHFSPSNAELQRFVSAPETVMACLALCVTPIRSISLKAKAEWEVRTGDAPAETAQLIRVFIQMRHGSQSITSLPVSLFKVCVVGGGGWSGACGNICCSIDTFLPHIDFPCSVNNEPVDVIQKHAWISVCTISGCTSM